MNPSPRVAIDAHRIIREPHSSGATYLGSLLSGFRDAGVSDNVVLLLPGVEQRSDLIPAGYRCEWGGAEAPERSMRAQVLWNQVTLPYLVRRVRPDVFFSPFHLTPLAMGRPIVTTVHDLCFMQMKDERGRLIHRALIETALLRATKLITVSRFTHEQLATFRSRAVRRATTVYNAVSEDTMERSRADDLVRELVPSVDDDPFVLWIGSLSARKAPRLVAETAALLSVPLVSVVPPAHVDRARALMGAGVALSSISNDQKRALLRRASVLLFPSRCEGFGYPAAEAMRQGCPVVSVSGGAVAELVGDLVPHSDPNAASLARVCDEVLTLGGDERVRLEADLVERSAKLFSEIECARRTWEVLTSAVG